MLHRRCSGERRRVHRRVAARHGRRGHRRRALRRLQAYRQAPSQLAEVGGADSDQRRRRQLRSALSLRIWPVLLKPNGMSSAHLLAPPSPAALRCSPYSSSLRVEGSWNDPDSRVTARARACSSSPAFAADSTKTAKGTVKTVAADSLTVTDSAGKDWTFAVDSQDQGRRQRRFAQDRRDESGG